MIILWREKGGVRQHYPDMPLRCLTPVKMNFAILSLCPSSAPALTGMLIEKDKDRLHVVARLNLCQLMIVSVNLDRDEC